MPIPKQNPGEKRNKFIERCMSDSVMNKEYPDRGQRYAVCLKQTKADMISMIDNAFSGQSYLINTCDIYVPNDKEYISKETGTPINISVAKYTYKDPETGELYYYSRRGIYKKHGRTLLYVSKADDNLRIILDSPFVNGDNYSVYVKNDLDMLMRVDFKKASSATSIDYHKWEPKYWSHKIWTMN